MAADLLYRFGAHWREGNFTDPQATVLLTVSGGIDSMVMADLFLKSNIPFAVAHCNFGLRAEASDLDAQLVYDWCSINSVPFHTVTFDTKQKMQEWKKGVQETARILRYEWFEEIRKTHGYAKIATAHHADDNVETLLINLFRGTGIAGLHGILPQSNYIIRPMLFATRDDIMIYAGHNEIVYREDASNQTDDYLRNAVRHNIVPVVKQWFPGAVNNVNDSVARFGEAEELYLQAIEQQRKKLIERRGNDHYIPVLKLRHRTPLATLCYELLQPFGFTPAQVPDAINLLDAESGRYISSATHRIIRNRDFLVVTAIPAQEADLILIEAVPCIIETSSHKYSFFIQNKPQVIPTDKDEACIAMKDITFPLVLRKWRIGDYFYPLGMKMKKKKVSRLMVDEKVALHEKEHVRILECEKRIAWVSGLRLDERFKVKDDTQQVLIVKRTPLHM